MIVDSHCHLDFPDFADEIDAVIARAHAAGVTRMVTISTFVSRVERYRVLAERFPSVFFTVGTHPHNAGQEPDVPAERLVDLARHPRCIGIGEAGLDYFYDKSPRDVQARVFRTHIAAARETGLPLVIHARAADEDMAAILTEEMGKGAFKAVLHCFSSGEALARLGIELGLYVSFSGILTFKTSDAIRQIARELPLDRLLVETDAPYLAPPPHRGKRCEPAYTALTAAILAHARGIPPETVAEATTANFYRLFDKAAACDGVAARAGAA